MLASVIRRVVLRLLRREQRAGAAVEQPDRVKSGDAHPDSQRPACRPVTVVVHGERGVAVVCAHLKEASDIRAVAAICAVLLVVVVFDPAKYQGGWEVSLGGVLAGGLTKSLGLPSSGVPVFVRRVIGTALAFGLVRAVVRIPTWAPWRCHGSGSAILSRGRPLRTATACTCRTSQL